MTQHFKLSPGANPKIQMLDTETPGMPSWSKTLEQINFGKSQASLSGKAFGVSRQLEFKVGDLVEWDPVGIRSVWRVTAVDRWRDASDASPRAIQTAFRSGDKLGDGLRVVSQVHDEVVVEVTNPCAEIEVTLGELNKSLLAPAPLGMIWLAWIGGWKGYEGSGLPVAVRIEAVHLLSPLEVLAICAA